MGSNPTPSAKIIYNKLILLSVCFYKAKTHGGSLMHFKACQIDGRVLRRIRQLFPSERKRQADDLVVLESHLVVLESHEAVATFWLWRERP